MRINPGIFKAYDIRGLYPSEINEAVAERLGSALGLFFKKKLAVVGYDARLSSRSLERSLVAGLRRAGVSVIRVGLVPTPVVSFGILLFRAGFGVVVSASHNPGRYNAFKIIDAKANQIGWDEGLLKIAALMEREAVAGQIEGTLKTKKVAAGYISVIVKKFRKKIRPLRMVADYGNGVGGITARAVFRKLGVRATHLFPKPDGRFPNHEPNPHNPKNFRAITAELKRGTYDLGVFFDGDADRVIFFDRWGNMIRPDIAAGIFATQTIHHSHILQNVRMKRRNKNQLQIYHDLRFSRAVVEEMKKAGGNPIRLPVGAPHYRQHIPEDKQAVLGAELSGHIFFPEWKGIDDGLFAALRMMEIISKTGTHLDLLAAPFNRYAQSGEVNIPSNNPSKTIQALIRKFKNGKQNRLDGLTVEFPDWWFNVRPSNTEPVLRINIEANDKKTLNSKTAQLLRIARST